MQGWYANRKTYLKAAKLMHKGFGSQYVCITLQFFFDDAVARQYFDYVYNPNNGVVDYFTDSDQTPRQNNEDRVLALLLLHEIESNGGL